MIWKSACVTRRRAGSGRACDGAEGGAAPPRSSEPRCAAGERANRIASTRTTSHAPRGAPRVADDVVGHRVRALVGDAVADGDDRVVDRGRRGVARAVVHLSLIHISEPTRRS
eukprot:5480279-Prymnesium_polylepis.2